MDKDLAGQVVDVARRVVASGAISANGHGNVSIRVPGAAEAAAPPVPPASATTSESAASVKPRESTTWVKRLI